MSDNELMIQYENKIKELEDELCRLDEERNSCLQNEKENYMKLVDEFNQFKEIDYKQLQENIQRTRLNYEVTIIN
jgi:hypothetical protein